MKITQTTYAIIPTGDYPAVIESIDDSDGMYGPQACFTFSIDGGEHQGAKVKAWASAKFSPKSRLYQWTQAAFGGAEIPPTYDFNSDDLIGRKVVVSILVKIKPEDGTEFSRVEGVRKWRPAGNGGGAPLIPPADDLFPPKGAGADDIPF